MKTYGFTTNPTALIFDMDNTLYTNSAYALHQEEVLVDRLAAQKNWTQEFCRKQIDIFRSFFIQNSQGKKPSLGNTFVNFGVSIQTSVHWRNELIKPELYLQEDPVLQATLANLSKDYILAVVTNNPVEVAVKTLRILGVQQYFGVVVGLDSTMLSKPDPAAFTYALGELKCPVAQIVSIGDRYEIDIEPALSLGMAGMLVDGVGELAQLGRILKSLQV